MSLPVSLPRRRAVEAAVKAFVRSQGSPPAKGSKRDFGELTNCEIVTHTHEGPDGTGRDVLIVCTHGGKQYVGRFAFDGNGNREFDFEELREGII